MLFAAIRKGAIGALGAMYCLSAAAQAPERKNLYCEIVKPMAAKRTEAVSLFYQTDQTDPKPVTKDLLDELSGRPIWFYFVVKRAENEFLHNKPIHGAVSVKIELVEPTSGNEVKLYNNFRKDESRACTRRDFNVYEDFHGQMTIDACLYSGFHNPPGSFSTVEPYSRRNLFLFPMGSNALWTSFLDRLFGSAEPLVRRISQIHNYVLRGDSTCIDFYAVPSAQATGIRIIADDLLENIFNNRAPRGWWEFQKKQPLNR
jgi:hypothetical protein